MRMTESFDISTPSEETVLAIDCKPSRRILMIVVTMIGLGTASWVWYAMFYANEVSSIKDYCRLAIWLYLVSSFVVLLLYELFGTESIRLAGFQVTIIRTLFGFSRKKVYDITLMKNLQVISRGYWGTSPGRPTYILPDGHVNFVYRGKTCEFGATLSDDEAFNLIHQIKNQISRLGS